MTKILKIRFLSLMLVFVLLGLYFNKFSCATAVAIPQALSSVGRGPVVKQGQFASPTPTSPATSTQGGSLTAQTPTFLAGGEFPEPLKGLMAQGTKEVLIEDDETTEAIGEGEALDDKEVVPRISREAMVAQSKNPITLGGASKALAKAPFKNEIVEVAFGDKTLVLDLLYLKNYQENVELLKPRNKDFSDGFEQSVLVHGSGIMYSSDLQWFYDKDSTAWQPVQYRFTKERDIEGGRVVEIGKLEVKVSGQFYDVPRRFLTDPIWHNKMQESKQFAAKSNSSDHYEKIRAGNFDAYLDFLQAAAPKELDRTQAETLDRLQTKARAQSLWQGAGKKVKTVNKIAKTQQPSPQPMTINVTVGSPVTTPANPPMVAQTPSAPPAAVSTPVFNVPPSFMTVVNPQGQPAQPNSGAYSPGAQSSGLSQGPLAPGAVFLIAPLEPAVANKIKAAFGIVPADEELGRKKAELDIKNSFLTSVIAGCKAILSEIQDLGKTNNQSQLGRLSFFQLVDSELTSAIGLCDRILSLTGTLKDKSNLLFYALRLWNDSDFVEGKGKEQMSTLIKHLVELLGVALDKQDEAADANEISIFTLFHRFGTSSAIQPLFDRIKLIFENLLSNHGLIVWMLAFGKLGELSRFLRRGAHVAAMPQLKIVQQGQSWTMADTPTSETPERDGSPGYHTPAKSSYNPIALYNSIGKGLQDCFGKLYNYGKAVNSQSTLIEIVTDLFKVLSTKSFVLFMAEPGFEEWRAIDGSKTAKDQFLQTLEGNSTDPSLLQGYFKNLTDPNFVGKLTASMLRELVAKKIIYLLGLLNTEVFQSLGFSLKKVFSSIKTRQQMTKMDETTRIYIGCLNQAILKSFVLQVDGGTKSMILPKDKFSQQVFNNWMETDTKNGKKIGLVFGATLLDAQLIERVLDWYKTFNTTVRSPAGVLKNIFTRGPDQRVSTLDNCLKSISSTLSDALYKQKYSKMSYSEVPGYWYYLISPDVSLRILKLVLMFFDKIKWFNELVAPSDYNSPILRISFKQLAIAMQNSGFLDGIESIGPQGGQDSQGGKIKTSFQSIANAPNPDQIKNDTNLLGVLNQIQGLSETC